MDALLHELIPHAPQLGLYVAPHIPEKKLENALRDYARILDPAEVIALYDNTLSGNGKDGAVFGASRFVFQNTDLDHPQEVRYDDLVEVTKQRGFLKGTRIHLQVNRARATFDLTLDCSAHSEAAEFLYRFLQEAMMHHPVRVDRPGEGEGETDRRAVEEALGRLHDTGKLARADYDRLLEALHG